MKTPSTEPSGTVPRGAARATRPGLGALPGILLGAGVAVVAVTLLALVRPPGGGGRPETPPREGRLGVARLDGDSADAVMRAEAELKDPTPLFLPTRFNAGARVGPPALEAVPGIRFEDLPAKLVFPAGRVTVAMPDPADLPSAVPGALRVGEGGNPYRGLGEADPKADSLPRRLGFLRIVPADGRPGTFEMALPPDTKAPPGDWAPITWTLAVTTAGVVGSLVPETGSGVEEWDVFFRIYLTETFPLGAWLGPGFYRATVGP